MDRANLLALLTKLRSYAEDDHSHVPLHFAGNPNYVEEDGPHGKRWHLAHPRPLDLHMHLQDHADGDKRGPLTIFGWEQEDWDGTRFGHLDARESEVFADAWGVANPKSLLARLTGAHPDMQNPDSMSYSLDDNASSYDRNEAVRDAGEDPYGGDWDRQYFAKEIPDREPEEDEDEEDVPTTTHYLDLRTGEWKEEPVRNFVAPHANVKILGKEIGEMTRTMKVEQDGNKSVYNDYWRGGTASGEGLSGLVYQSQLEAYRAAGADEVTVTANISSGSYLWARHGFEAQDDSDVYMMQRNIKSALRDVFDEHGTGGTIDHDFDVDDLNEPLPDLWKRTIGDRDPEKLSDDEAEDLIANAQDEDGDELSDEAKEGLEEYRGYAKQGLFTDSDIGKDVWSQWGRDLEDFDTPTEVEEALGDRDNSINTSKRFAQRAIAQHQEGVRAHQEAANLRRLYPTPEEYAMEKVQPNKGKTDEELDAMGNALPKAYELSRTKTDLETAKWQLEHTTGLSEEDKESCRQQIAQLEQKLTEHRATRRQEHEDPLGYVSEYIGKAYPHHFRNAGEYNLARGEVESALNADDYAERKIYRSQPHLDLMNHQQAVKDLQDWVDITEGDTPEERMANYVKEGNDPENAQKLAQRILGKDDPDAYLLHRRKSALADLPYAQENLAGAQRLYDQRRQALKDRYNTALEALQKPVEIPPIPAPYSGPEPFTKDQDHAAIRHWINERGWVQGESLSGQQGEFTEERRQEIEDEIDSADTMPELSLFTIPEGLGVPEHDRYIAKSGMASENWPGRYDLNSRSIGDDYRAQKIKDNWLSHEKGEPKPKEEKSQQDDKSVQDFKRLVGVEPNEIPHPTDLYKRLQGSGVTQEQRDAALKTWEQVNPANQDNEDVRRGVWEQHVGRGGTVMPESFDTPGEVLAHAKIKNGGQAPEPNVSDTLLRHFHRKTGLGFNDSSLTAKYTPESAWYRVGRQTNFTDLTNPDFTRQDIAPQAIQHLDQLSREYDAETWQKYMGDTHPRTVQMPENVGTDLQRRQNYLADEATYRSGSQPSSRDRAELLRQWERHHVLHTLPTPESEVWDRWFNSPNTAHVNAADIGGQDMGVGVIRNGITRRIERASPDHSAHVPLTQKDGDEDALYRHWAQAQRGRGRGSTDVYNPDYRQLTNSGWKALAYHAAAGNHKPSEVNEKQIRTWARQQGLDAQTTEDAVTHWKEKQGSND